MVAIRNEIVLGVVTALNLPISDADRARLVACSTVETDIFDTLLRAREMRATATRAMAREAIRTLEDAVPLAPEFALVWSELAVTLDMAAEAGWTDDVEASRAHAIKVAERALALDPSLGPAHTVVGAALHRQGEVERAIRELEAGVAAAPNAARPVATLGRHLPDHDRPAEGLQLMERAFRLQPDAPGWYFEARDWARFVLGRHEEAVADFAEATLLGPDDLGPRLGLILGHAAVGRFEEARAAAEHVVAIAPGLSCEEARAGVVDPVLRERQVAQLRRAGLPARGSGMATPPEAEAMLANWIDTFTANLPPKLDPDALADLYAEECFCILPLREITGGPIRSRDAQRRFFITFDDHWATLTMIEVSRVTQGRRAVWESVMEGVHKESGKPVSMPVVFFFEFDNNGKVKEQHIYADYGLVEEQMR